MSDKFTKIQPTEFKLAHVAIALSFMLSALAQASDNPPPRDPQDSNETFMRPEGGPGGGRFGGPGGRGGFGPGMMVSTQQNFGGPGGGFGGRGGGRGPGGFGGGQRIEGVKLEPLVAEKDSNKPLISKLLAVPSFRARYLGYVRDIAEKWLDWNQLGPIAARYHSLIAADVKLDTRKLDSTEDFEKGLMEDVGGGGFGGGGPISLKSFADQRRTYLLSHQR